MSHFIETFEKADINISAAGDNTVIAAPGDGRYLAIDFIQFITTSATIVQYKDGATAYGGPLPLPAYGSVTAENTMQNEHGIITLSNNSAFVINLTAGSVTGGFIRYRIINK